MVIGGNLMVIQWSSGSDSKDHGWITFTDQLDQFRVDVRTP